MDAVIFATGLRPALDHIVPLGVVGADGRVSIQQGGAGARASRKSLLWLVGYGDWTGFSSATLIGVGRSARATAQEITAAFGAGVTAE